MFLPVEVLILQKMHFPQQHRTCLFHWWSLKLLKGWNKSLQHSWQITATTTMDQVTPGSLKFMEGWDGRLEVVSSWIMRADEPRCHGVRRFLSAVILTNQSHFIPMPDVQPLPVILFLNLDTNIIGIVGYLMLNSHL